MKVNEPNSGKGMEHDTSPCPRCQKSTRTAHQTPFCPPCAGTLARRTNANRRRQLAADYASQAPPDQLSLENHFRDKVEEHATCPDFLPPQNAEPFSGYDPIGDRYHDGIPEDYYKD